ncbi:hypothetical protein [Baaleninema simplex]|uniref:hypothetical protein n=1 Tax=Baaleninema simplex TaxID=2862350 RepID=UPI00034D429D|nr:hypothetical protein [Baaleninema simplex]
MNLYSVWQNRDRTQTNRFYDRGNLPPSLHQSVEERSPRGVASMSSCSETSTERIHPRHAVVQYN